MAFLAFEIIDLVNTGLEIYASKVEAERAAQAEAILNAYKEKNDRLEAAKVDRYNDEVRIAEQLVRGREVTKNIDAATARQKAAILAEQANQQSQETQQQKQQQLSFAQTKQQNYSTEMQAKIAEAKRQAEVIAKSKKAAKQQRKAAPKFFAKTGRGIDSGVVSYIKDYYGVSLKEAKKIYKIHF
jgi:hypothetical protein